MNALTGWVDNGVHHTVYHLLKQSQFNETSKIQELTCAP